MNSIQVTSSDIPERSKRLLNCKLRGRVLEEKSKTSAATDTKLRIAL